MLNIRGIFYKLMNKEEIKTYFEALAQDSNLDVSNRLINKFVNMSLELSQDGVDDVDEIKDEFVSIAPNDEDDWMDFVDEASTYIFDQILDQDCETEEETE